MASEFVSGDIEGPDRRERASRTRRVECVVRYLPVDSQHVLAGCIDSRHRIVDRLLAPDRPQDLLFLPDVAGFVGDLVFPCELVGDVDERAFAVHFVKPVELRVALREGRFERSSDPVSLLEIFRVSPLQPLVRDDEQSMFRRHRHLSPVPRPNGHDLVCRFAESVARRRVLELTPVGQCEDFESVVSPFESLDVACDCLHS
jgi:hypothetical protein